MLNEAQASRHDGPPTPDVILFDNDALTIPIIIEVCHTVGLKKDINKVIRLINEDEYGILEGFIYDYKTENWLRYGKGNAGLMTQTSFSDVLNLDLKAMLVYLTQASCQNRSHLINSQLEAITTPIRP